MKKLLYILVLLLVPAIGFSQEDEEKKEVKKKDKVERPAFESSAIIENQTNVLFGKNSMEAQMQHRFGVFGKQNDFLGIWGASNIRLGVSYALHDRLTVGFGGTKDQRYIDFNWKLALLQQTRSGRTPLSITYYGNFANSALPEENFNMVQDRYSYFHQIIFARRFSPAVSFQIAPSISHYNVVESTMKNDMWGLNIGGRIKFSDQGSVLLDYSQPLTQFEENNPEPGMAIGFEFATSAHAFQIFVSNYHGIIQQDNYMFNQYNFWEGEMFIGFNITRVYNF